MSNKASKMRSRKDSIVTGTSNPSLGNISLARFLAEPFGAQVEHAGTAASRYRTKKGKYANGELAKSSDLSLRECEV